MISELADRQNVGIDVFERTRFERNDARIAAYSARRTVHDGIRDSAHLTEFLGDDEVRREPLEQIAVQMVKAGALMKRLSDVAIDVCRACRMRQSRRSEVRKSPRLLRKIAFVRDADNFPAGTDAEEYFRRAW